MIIKSCFVFREALIDADLILKNTSRALNPNKHFNMNINQQYSVAYNVKGDALYHLGDFEHALLNYHRANKYTLKRVNQLLDIVYKFKLDDRITIFIGQLKFYCVYKYYNILILSILFLFLHRPTLFVSSIKFNRSTSVV